MGRRLVPGLPLRRRGLFFFVAAGRVSRGALKLARGLRRGHRCQRRRRRRRVFFSFAAPLLYLLGDTRSLDLFDLRTRE